MTAAEQAAQGEAALGKPMASLPLFDVLALGFCFILGVLDGDVLAVVRFNDGTDILGLVNRDG